MDSSSKTRLLPVKDQIFESKEALDKYMNSIDWKPFIAFGRELPVYDPLIGRFGITYFDKLRSSSNRHLTVEYDIIAEDRVRITKVRKKRGGDLTSAYFILSRRAELLDRIRLDLVDTEGIILTGNAWEGTDNTFLSIVKESKKPYILNPSLEDFLGWRDQYLDKSSYCSIVQLGKLPLPDSKLLDYLNREEKEDE